MIAAAYLAWAHIRFHAGRSALLVIVLCVLSTIPLMTERLAAIAKTQLLARANTTPLIYGPAGSQLEQALAALFFEGNVGQDLTMADFDAIADSGLALPLPLLTTHTAGRFPIVGTDLEYLTFRHLSLARGRMFARLGEAVIGARVAAALAVGPGENILSDANAIFELAGAYPLRMSVVGVLAATGGPDDRAVFTDLNTAWVVMGLGHGHQDLASTRDNSIILKRNGSNIVANAKLKEYIEITAENRDSFHFHGDQKQYPLSVIIVDPADRRSAAVLRGRIEDAGPGRQIFRPVAVIQALLDEVFRIKAVFQLLVGAVSGAALIALGTLIWLSLKLRRPEFEIAYRLGADRGAMARLVITELGILGLAAGGLCAALIVGLNAYGSDLVRRALFGG